MESRAFGLIGGLGPPATVFYYRALVAAHAARGACPRLLIVHADMAHALVLVQAGDVSALARYLASLLDQLARAGAELAAISAVTPHIAMPELRPLSPLPLIDIIDTLVSEMQARRVRRVAVLGTQFTMRQRLFGRLEAFELVELSEAEISQVHRIYTAIAADGGASEADTRCLIELGEALQRERGAEAIVLAGTELSIVLSEENCAFPLFDCAKLHIGAITGATLAPSNAA